MMAKLRPGASTRDVERAGKKAIEEAGFKRSRPLAHGLGLEAPEEPIIGFPTWEAEPMELTPGMTLTLEPNPILPTEKMEVRLGSTIVVTDTGPRNLHKVPLELRTA
jgi:Xaa-Pro aminopeptidase